MEKKKKPAKEMTSEEALQHLWHPNAVKQIKKHVEKLERLNTKKA
jgi:hypothetical protein